MQSPALMGPYRLTFDDIGMAVRRRSAGAFALGYVDERGNFRIRYVGRSDDDVRRQLCNMIGSDQYFKYAYHLTPGAAFQKECELFHDFTPYANVFHPERPRGTNLECPRCRAGSRRRVDR